MCYDSVINDLKPLKLSCMNVTYRKDLTTLSEI